MHLYPARVAYDLKYETTDHGYEKYPCSVTNPLEDLEKEEDGEDCEVEGVAEEGGDVVDLCFGDGASGYGAFDVGD